jgi:leukotriene-A4 hydrolase
LLAQKYGLNESNNFELLLPYIQIGIKAKWPPIIPKALKFVQSNGRIKYLKPVYADLLNWEESHPQAIATFKKDVPFMHPITIGVVSNLIKAIKH